MNEPQNDFEMEGIEPSIHPDEFEKLDGELSGDGAIATNILGNRRELGWKFRAKVNQSFRWDEKTISKKLFDSFWTELTKPLKEINHIDGKLEIYSFYGEEQTNNRGQVSSMVYKMSKSQYVVMAIEEAEMFNKFDLNDKREREYHVEMIYVNNRKEWMKYDREEKIWVCIPVSELENKITQYYLEKFGEISSLNEKSMNAAIRFYRNRHTFLGKMNSREEYRDVVKFKNGKVQFNSSRTSFAFIDYSIRDYITHKLQFNYIIHPQLEWKDTFIHEKLAEIIDQHDDLTEQWLDANLCFQFQCLFPVNVTQKCMMNFGEPGCGKSVLSELTFGILGNKLAISLRAKEVSSTFNGCLLDKQLLLIDEMSVVQDDFFTTINTYISQQETSLRDMRVVAQAWIPSTTVVMNLNEMPENLPRSTNGFWDRTFAQHYKNHFRDTAGQIKDLQQVLLSKTEEVEVLLSHIIGDIIPETELHKQFLISRLGKSIDMIEEYKSDGGIWKFCEEFLECPSLTPSQSSPFLANEYFVNAYYAWFKFLRNSDSSLKDSTIRKQLGGFIRKTWPRLTPCASNKKQIMGKRFNGNFGFKLDMEALKNLRFVGMRTLLKEAGFPQKTIDEMTDLPQENTSHEPTYDEIERILRGSPKSLIEINDSFGFDCVQIMIEMTGRNICYLLDDKYQLFEEDIYTSN